MAGKSLDRLRIAVGFIVIALGMLASYLFIRALLIIPQYISLDQLVLMYAIEAVLVGVMAYSFVFLVGSFLVEKPVVSFMFIPLYALGIASLVLLKDISLFVNLVVSGTLFVSGLIVRLFSTRTRGEILVPRKMFAASLVLLAVFLIAPMLLNYISGFLGLAGKLVFHGREAFVPTPLGYKVLPVEEAVRGITINGSMTRIELFNGETVLGFVEKLREYIIQIATKLGRITINVTNTKIPLEVVAPPKPVKTPLPFKPKQPPQHLLELVKLSSLIQKFIDRSGLITIVNILYSILLITYGLLLARGGEK